MLQRCDMSCATTTWFWLNSPKTSCPCPRSVKSCALLQDSLGGALPRTPLTLCTCEAHASWDLWAFPALGSPVVFAAHLSPDICACTPLPHIRREAGLLCKCQEFLLPLCKAVWLEKLVLSFCSLELQLYPGTGELRSSSTFPPRSQSCKSTC